MKSNMLASLRILLNEANKEAEKSHPEAAPVNEVMPAK